MKSRPTPFIQISNLNQIQNDYLVDGVRPENYEYLNPLLSVDLMFKACICFFLIIVQIHLIHAVIFVFTFKYCSLQRTK